MSNLGHIKPGTIVNIPYKVTDYPCANLYTTWYWNINPTNIFQFLTIFAQNLAILPQKRMGTHFKKSIKLFLISETS